MIAHHCDVCGCEVEDACPHHPNADIVSVVVPLTVGRNRCDGVIYRDDKWHDCALTVGHEGPHVIARKEQK